MLDQAEIRRRIRIGRLLIGMLAKDEDPRAPDVIAILSEQVAELEERLAELGIATPQVATAGSGCSASQQAPRDDRGEDVVVGLDTLSLQVKRH